VLLLVCNDVNSQTTLAYWNEVYPTCVAINDVTSKVHVTNYQVGTVSVVDTDSGKTKDKHVGDAPTSIIQFRYALDY
jgi:DNA-binding beta-propeller fold protein YncE